MKVQAVFVALLVCAGSIASAQNPGYKPPELPKSGAPGGSDNSAGEVKAAGLVNSMDQLDNLEPLAPDYMISFRIIEDRSEPIRLRVQDSGDVQAPHVGLVRAAGKTCRSLAQTIKAQLEKDYYSKATVIIAIDQRPPPGQRTRIGTQDLETFTVFGQVARQGKYELPYDSDITISQAILMAGGPAQFANLKKVRLIRKTPSGNKTVQVDVDAIMAHGMLDRDIYIRKGDVLILPEKVYNF